MRFFSASILGLWSSVKGNTKPLRSSTARVSPQCATTNLHRTESSRASDVVELLRATHSGSYRLRQITATTAVDPACHELARQAADTSASIASNAVTMAGARNGTVSNSCARGGVCDADVIVVVVVVVVASGVDVAAGALASARRGMPSVRGEMGDAQLRDMAAASSPDAVRGPLTKCELAPDAWPCESGDCASDDGGSTSGDGAIGDPD